MHVKVCLVLAEDPLILAVTDITYVTAVVLDVTRVRQKL